MRRARLTLAAGVTSAAALASALAPSACDDARVDAPCSVGAAATAFTIDGEGLPIAFDLVEESDHTILATWTRLRSSPDAGTSKLGRAERARVGRDGSVLSRAQVDAPAELLAREASTEQAGAAWTDAGALWRWVETSVQTAPNGILTRSARVVFAFTPQGGGPAIVTAPAELACTGCSVALTLASDGERVLVVASIARQSGAAEGWALRFDRQGALASIARAPDFVQPLPTAPVPPTAAVETPNGAGQLGEERGDFFFFSSRGTWVLGPSLERRAGRLPPATPGSFVRFDPPGDVAFLAPAPGTGTGEPYVVLSPYDAAGSLRRTPSPVTRASAVLGVTPLGDGGHLVATRGEDGVVLSRLEASGAKRAFDVTASGTGTSYALVATEPFAARLFTYASNKLSSVEVRCAP